MRSNGLKESALNTKIVGEAPAAQPLFNNSKAGICLGITLIALVSLFALFAAFKESLKPAYVLKNFQKKAVRSVSKFSSIFVLKIFSECNKQDGQEEQFALVAYLKGGL